MAYKVFFTGLACFIEPGDGTYLVALPDGRDAKDSAGKPIPHQAHVVVTSADVDKGLSISNWPAGPIRNGMIFLPMDAGSVLKLPFANDAGKIDDGQYRLHRYLWSDLDGNFQIKDRL